MISTIRICPRATPSVAMCCTGLKVLCIAHVKEDLFNEQELAVPKAMILANGYAMSAPQQVKRSG